MRQIQNFWHCYHKFLKHVIKRKQINYDSDEKKKARTPPRTTLSTTNNVTPNVTLDALGLNPVVEAPWTGGTTRHPKTSVLKFAVVKELQ